MSSTVLFIGGYACSGKSTALKYLGKNYDCHILSTSAILHQVLTDIYSVFGLKNIDTHDKDSTLFFDALVVGDEDSLTTTRVVSSHGGKDGREILIDVAEKVLVKSFSRQVFALGVQTAYSQLPHTDKPQLIVIETIGGLEYEKIRDWFLSMGFYTSNINIVSPSANPEADGRQLLPLTNTCSNVTNTLDSDFMFNLDATMNILKLNNWKKTND